MKKTPEIESLTNKIEAFKKKEKAKAVAAQTPVQAQGAAKGFNLCIEFLCGVFIGLAIGVFLDKVFDTTPIYLAVFTIFGGAAGVLNMYRYAKLKDGEH